MKRIFVDANILISVLNKEYPLFQYSARVLSLQSYQYTLVTTNICVAIAFYFAEKKHGSKLAKSKISILLDHIEIADCGEVELALALKNKKVEDLEDGLQYYAAFNNKCSYIVTENAKDFYFADGLKVMDSKSFLVHIFNRK